MQAQRPSGNGKLGRYELLGRIATGGMGEIFLARLEGAAGFEKLYVVKKILPHLASDERFRRMLIDEARIASRMSHPNICQVYELDETNGQLFIVMEYLEGVTVLPLLRRASKAGTPLPLGLITSVVSQTCEALHYAHELTERDGTLLNIVHRDVTPSNIFITETGVAKVLDFGIAKVKNASAQTQTGTVKGKYAYMAPEQLRGAELDRRVDVFALGVVMFEMLSLRRLFQRKTDYLTFRAVMEQEIPDFRRYRQDVGAPLVDVMTRTLSRDPATRISTVRELGTAVLDATPGTRAWSNGEIGDFLKSNFADVIRKRSAALVLMTSRETRPVGRSTMPILADMGGAMDQESDADDDEFPSVESDIHDPLPVDRAPSASDFAVQTPPPFSTDVASQPAGIPLHMAGGSSGRVDARAQSAREADPNAGVGMHPVAHGRRSLALPIIGTLLVAIAGTALFLLWQQSKKDQAAPANIVINQSERIYDAAVQVAQVAADADTSQAGSSAGSGSGKRGSGSDISRPPGKQPGAGAIATSAEEKAFKVILQKNFSAISDCLPQFDSERNADMAGVKVTLDNNGKPSTVELLPSSNTFTPFGACVRSAVGSMQFSGLGGKLFKFALKPTQ